MTVNLQFIASKPKFELVEIERTVHRFPAPAIVEDVEIRVHEYVKQALNECKRKLNAGRTQYGQDNVTLKKITLYCIQYGAGYFDQMELSRLSKLDAFIKDNGNQKQRDSWKSLTFELSGKTKLKFDMPKKHQEWLCEVADSTHMTFDTMMEVVICCALFLAPHDLIRAMLRRHAGESARACEKFIQDMIEEGRDKKQAILSNRREGKIDPDEGKTFTWSDRKLL